MAFMMIIWVILISFSMIMAEHDDHLGEQDVHVGEQDDRLGDCNVNSGVDMAQAYRMIEWEIIGSQRDDNQEIR